MSDTSQGPGWWLASDGRWYPPTTAPGPTPPPPSPTGASAPLPGPAVSPVLAVLVQVAFGFTAAIYALGLGLTLHARSTFDAAWQAPVADLELLRRAIDADERLASFAPISVVVNLGLLALLIVWMWQSHGATDRLRPGERRWGRGWTIGGWFVPFANLVIPKRVMNEMERIATAPRIGGVLAPGWRQVDSSAIGWAWWVLFVAAWIGGRVANGMVDDATESLDATAALDAYLMMAITSSLAIGSAACGAVLIGRISRRLSPSALAATDDEEPNAPR